MLLINLAKNSYCGKLSTQFQEFDQVFSEKAKKHYLGFIYLFILLRIYADTGLQPKPYQFCNKNGIYCLQHVISSNENPCLGISLQLRGTIYPWRDGDGDCYMQQNKLVTHLHHSSLVLFTTHLLWTIPTICLSFFALLATCNYFHH